VAHAPRAFAFRHELARKALHILTVAAPLAYAGGLSRRVLILLLVAASIIVVALEIVRARHATTRAIFQRTVGAILRPHEHDQWAGATWLILAFLGVVLLAPRDVAITAMWAVSAGDAVAALVGRGVARARGGTSRKTFAGSAACFVVTLGGALLVAQLSPVEGVIAAAAATAAEWPQGGIDDNLRIVTAVALALLAWRIAFP